MKPIIDSLESDRLVLEPRREHHASELFDLFCEQDLYHFMKRDVPTSAEWLAKGFKALESLTSPDGEELWFGWVGRGKVSHRPVGVFEMTVVSGNAHLGYTVFKEFWGKRFAVGGSRAMMGYIHQNYPPERFIIEMDTRNWASIKVAEKLGFDFVKVTNNVTFIKNFVSHEFQFQKVAGLPV
jgi:RimJ/RimL family protein N-acetyltransferase